MCISSVQSQCVFGAYLCCDQARPPAGDLGRGGAVLEKRKEGGGEKEA